MTTSAATRRLARFAADCTFAELPPPLVDRAKVYVLDNLAAGLLGASQPWSTLVVDTLRHLGGAAQASIFRHPLRTDTSRATLANGVMLGAFEAEHVGHAAHPSATVFPAALATAEAQHSDGRSFLLALLLGYEVVCRVGAAQTRATEDERGFHNPGVNGAFGAATATGKLLGLDHEHLAWALGIAGSHACGLVEFIHEGAMTKRMHPGRAAQLGLESALLARCGFTGPTTVLEGAYGYLQAYSPHPEPARLVAGLGDDWLAASITIKAYACHSTSQAVVHAIQNLKQRSQALDPRAIRGVTLHVEPRAAEPRFGERQPRTLLGAQYSLPFTTAVALARDLDDPRSFDLTTLTDPLILDLARRIQVEATPDTPHLQVETADQVLHQPAATFPGSPSQPLDLAAAFEKLRRFAGPDVPEARLARMRELVTHLDELTDVADLAATIAD